MTKKIFLIWDRYTKWCVRALFAFTIPAALWEIYYQIFCCFLFILWLIIKTGYEKKWNDTEVVTDYQTEKGGEAE